MSDSICAYRTTLTKRKKEVLRLACLPNSEIGKRLNLSTTTVATHFVGINQILGTSGKASAIIEGIRRGEINIDEVETE